MLAADALSGVKAKHLGKEIDSKRICMREKGRKRNTGFDWQRPDVILGLRGINIGINNQLIDKPEVIQHGGEYLQMEYPNNEESGSTGQRSYNEFSTQFVFAKKKNILSTLIDGLPTKQFG